MRWLADLSNRTCCHKDKLFLRPSATKSKVAPPGGAKCKKWQNDQIWFEKKLSENGRRFIKISGNVKRVLVMFGENFKLVA